MSRVLLLALVVMLAASPAAEAQRRNSRAAEAAANAADIEAGQTRMAYLARAICPGLESRQPVPGLETPAQREAVIADRWTYAQNRLTALTRVENELRAVLASQTSGGAGARAQQELAALEADAEAAYARVGAQLTDWWLAQSVGMREINPTYPPGVNRPHPLGPFLESGAQLRALLQPYGGRAAFQQYLKPVIEKFDRCLGEIQDQVVNANTNEIRAVIPRQTSSAAFRSLEAHYAVAPGGFDARGAENVPVVIAELRSAMAVVVRREEEEAERRRIMADAAARAEYERQQRAAAAADAARQAELRRMLVVAERFVAAARTGSVSGMSATLHPDVVVYAPQRPPAHGKDAVISSIRSGMSQGGAPPTFGAVQIGSGGIYAPMQAQRYNLLMSFQFAAGQIRQINITQ